MVEQDANERDDVGANGERIAPEVPRGNRDAIRHRGIHRRVRRALSHRRQVEHGHGQMRPPRRERAREPPFPAADIHDGRVTSEGIGIERLGDHRARRRRHEGAIVGDVLGLRIGAGHRIWIVPAKRRLPLGSTTQQIEGLAQVVIQQRVMLDERAQRLVADERRAEGAESDAIPRTSLEQPECHGRPDQSLRRGERQAHACRELFDGQRRAGEEREQVELHARPQYL